MPATPALRWHTGDSVSQLRAAVEKTGTYQDQGRRGCVRDREHLALLGRIEETRQLALAAVFARPLSIAFDLLLATVAAGDDSTSCLDMMLVVYAARLLPRRLRGCGQYRFFRLLVHLHCDFREHYLLFRLSLRIETWRGSGVGVHCWAIGRAGPKKSGVRTS